MRTIVAGQSSIQFLFYKGGKRTKKEREADVRYVDLETDLMYVPIIIPGSPSRTPHFWHSHLRDVLRVPSHAFGVKYEPLGRSAPDSWPRVSLLPSVSRATVLLSANHHVFKILRDDNE